MLNTFELPLVREDDVIGRCGSVAPPSLIQKVYLLCSISRGQMRDVL